MNLLNYIEYMLLCWYEPFYGVFNTAKTEPKDESVEEPKEEPVEEPKEIPDIPKEEIKSTSACWYLHTDDLDSIEKSDFLCDLFKNSSTVLSQRSCVLSIRNFINSHNNKITNKELFVPVTNCGNNRGAYTAYVIGFDGKRHPANILLGTSCFDDTVIGSGLAKKAGIESDEFGCSYVFVIKTGDNREFIGHGAYDATKYAGSNEYRVMSYAEDLEINGKNTGACGSYQNELIDIIVGYRMIKEMAIHGIIPIAANTNTNTNRVCHSNITKIPFSFMAGLKTKIDNHRAITHINTGIFWKVDLVISHNWFAKKYGIEIFNPNSKFFENKKTVSITIIYNNVEIILTDLTFICMTENLFDDNDELLDCCPTKQFMEKLAEKNIYPMIL